jgi:predicted 3-demethylubiquinone-9 3-methyltransferase (glyoxalase superfamily)
VGGASRVAEALAAAGTVVGIRDLAREINADASYRRIGSIATTLSLPVAQGLELPVWRSLIELDRKARDENGWVDKTWGVAWPYPATELEAVVAA